MKNVFIADLKTFENICKNNNSSAELLSIPFKDSLVVYSFKEKIKSFNELKTVVNSYRSIWEEIINNGSESCLDDYSQMMNNLERLGTVVNTSKIISITSDVPKPEKIYSEISVFLENFEGEVIIWNNDVTGDPHILGLGEKINFFTVNNYL